MSCDSVRALASRNLRRWPATVAVLPSLVFSTGRQHADGGKQSDPISTSQVMNMEEDEDSVWWEASTTAAALTPGGLWLLKRLVFLSLWSFLAAICIIGVKLSVVKVNEVIQFIKCCQNARSKCEGGWCYTALSDGVTSLELHLICTNDKLFHIKSNFFTCLSCMSFFLFLPAPVKTLIIKFPFITCVIIYW